MREAYGKGQEFLQTKTPELPKDDDLKRMFRSEFLRMAGFTDEEIEMDSLWEMSEERLREVIRDHLLGATANDNHHQIVTGIDDIERYVAEGWEFVTALPNDKVILRHPS